MIYSSLAVIALSASAVINPFTNLVHMHPRPAQPDHRVEIRLYNKGITFQDVKIGDHNYTVPAHQGLMVKAPAGTVIYANSSTNTYHRGQSIVEVTPTLNQHQVDLN